MPGMLDLEISERKPAAYTGECSGRTNSKRVFSGCFGTECIVLAALFTYELADVRVSEFNCA